ncbi:MAG: hypothetical protein EBZ00_06100 [Actinobacteria bacterium]|nr:hypothetical protein [Actinomycetota bacterium]
MLPLQTLAQALASFHAEVGRILKQSSAQYGKYADLATVLTTVSPVLSKHGLVVTQTTLADDAGQILECHQGRTLCTHVHRHAVTVDIDVDVLTGHRCRHRAANIARNE